MFIAAGGMLFGLLSLDCLQINKALKAVSPSPTPAAGNDTVTVSVVLAGAGHLDLIKVEEEEDVSVVFLECVAVTISR